MPYGEKGRLFHSSSKKRENIKPKRRREKNDKRLRGKNVNVYAINGVRESPTEIAMALINCLIDPAHISCLCVGNDTTISSFFSCLAQNVCKDHCHKETWTGSSRNVCLLQVSECFD